MARTDPGAAQPELSLGDGGESHQTAGVEVHYSACPLTGHVPLPTGLACLTGSLFARGLMAVMHRHQGISIWVHAAVLSVWPCWQKWLCPRRHTSSAI